MKSSKNTPYTGLSNQSTDNNWEKNNEKIVNISLLQLFKHFHRKC